MLRTLTIAATFLATTATAEAISFANWNEQRLKLLSSNDYTQSGGTLGIRSDNTVSILWTRLPQPLWDATRAQWNWQVTQSVPPTDLGRKGGDDRNIAVYFLWLPAGAAAAASQADIRSLLGRDDVRIIQYVWGGNNAVGQPIPSPYGVAGTAVTIPLRQADTGQDSVTVDLAADHARAFGSAPGALVGMAVSADSDDTVTMIEAQVSGLRVE
ncbi:DUF3047 domain-containing protein [Loktanella sp. SALINAS62]|uniref:DUF3047 domain-containing protein n=1 Tax=Loktanella sp. SALINAS62 TaxID=2706124 RepID=UPI001B8B2A74|nr:DUF3047 domain-containing protein [Loktanella sp. SALINAS62]MBS1303127.1 DUF3047 domain-containing protein [Loktanella sp. SALINAS62]